MEPRPGELFVMIGADVDEDENFMTLTNMMTLMTATNKMTLITVT